MLPAVRPFTGGLSPLVQVGSSRCAAVVRPLVAVALVAVLGAGCATRLGTETLTAPTPSPTPSPVQPGSSPRSPTPSAAATGRHAPSPATTDPHAGPQPSPARPLLRAGMRGSDVHQLQQRLTELGYWLGGADGSFGDLTRQAVLAVQKAAGLARDGTVGPDTAQALAAGTRAQPRSTVGSVIEIDKTRQLLLVVRDGSVRWVFNTSTGSGAAYRDRGGTAWAVTPNGKFVVYREVDGQDVSPLGVLWRPKYFTRGIAIHAYDDVPPYPASHGCVRVSDPAIDFFWATGIASIGTAVWVY